MAFIHGGITTAGNNKSGSIRSDADPSAGGWETGGEKDPDYNAKLGPREKRTAPKKTEKKEGDGVDIDD